MMMKKWWVCWEIGLASFNLILVTVLVIRNVFFGSV